MNVIEYNFCPGCGHPLEDRELFGRMRRVCPRCGFIHFHDPKVAVGVLVEDDRGRVLLVRRAVVPGRGLWGFPSGFMEYDEVPRVAAQREVEEETGLQVRIEELLDIVPMGGKLHRGIIILYTGKPVSGTLQPGDDVSEVRWFAADEIPYDELAFASARHLLEAWQRNQIEKAEARRQNED